MRKKIIAANWKMNFTAVEAADYLKTFLLEVADERRVEIVIVPPFTAISKTSECLKDSSTVKLGAQNMSAEKSGAFTGEVSAMMLREFLVSHVVLGHSERRTIFGETDAIVNKKTRAAIDASLKPIVCIGETLAERDAGQVEAVLEKQVRGSLAGLSAEEVADLVLAYEPVWAIGTGRTATPEQAQQAHAFIRSLIATVWDKAADKVRIQYGGSVKPDNTQSLMSQPDIDGALVGGAALDPRAFASIVKTSAGIGA
jgi:triosephosphate isomerase